MTALAVRIMHAPGYGREAMLRRHLDLLGTDSAVDLAVTFDPRGGGPHPPPPSVWQTARAAWQEIADSGADHGLVLCDDSLPCANFLRAAVITTRRAGGPVSFWTRQSKHVAAARSAGTPWVLTRGRACGLAMHLPGRQIRPFLEWVEMREQEACPSPVPAEPWKPTGEDTRLRHWLRVTGQKVWTTVPSLIEHATPETSTIGHANRLRVAAWFIEEGNPLLIDWRREPVIA